MQISYARQFYSNYSLSDVLIERCSSIQKGCVAASIPLVLGSSKATQHRTTPFIFGPERYCPSSLLYSALFWLWLDFVTRALPAGTPALYVHLSTADILSSYDMNMPAEWSNLNLDDSCFLLLCSFLFLISSFGVLRVSARRASEFLNGKAWITFMDGHTENFSILVTKAESGARHEAKPPILTAFLSDAMSQYLFQIQFPEAGLSLSLYYDRFAYISASSWYCSWSVWISLSSLRSSSLFSKMVNAILSIVTNIHAGLLISAAAAFIPICSMSVGLRIYARKSKGMGLLADDWWIMIALVCHVYLQSSHHW